MLNFLSKFASFWKSHYRAVVYILTFAFVWLALINKKPLDLSVSDATQGALDLVEKMPENHRKKIVEQEKLLAKLQKEESRHSSAELTAQIDEAKAYLERLKINSNGVFLVCIDFDAGSDAELGPMAYSSIRHAFSLGIKVLINNGYTVMAQPLSQIIVDSAALGGATMPRPYGFKEAGSDFVFSPAETSSSAPFSGTIRARIRLSRSNCRILPNSVRARPRDVSSPNCSGHAADANASRSRKSGTTSRNASAHSRSRRSSASPRSCCSCSKSPNADSC